MKLKDSNRKLYNKMKTIKKIPRRNKLAIPTIVRIEASAGGLDTIEALFANLNARRTLLQRKGDHILMSEYVPPGIMINSDMEIIQVHGRTAPFLELAPGQSSLNLMKMLRPELIQVLRAAIQTAQKKTLSIKKEGLRIRDNDHWKYFTLMFSRHEVFSGSFVGLTKMGIPSTSNLRIKVGFA